MLVDPVDGAAFQIHVESQPVPMLSRGDIVVLDIPGSHKTEAVHEEIRDAGARILFLPPCSPDLSPIKQVFAKLKHWLLDAQPRCCETPWLSVGDTRDQFKP